MAAQASSLMRFGAVAALSVAGCLNIESPNVYSPAMANVDIMFDTVDRRPDAGEALLETGALPPSHKYADEQFVRVPTQVAAGRFAADTDFSVIWVCAPGALDPQTRTAIVFSEAARLSA